jgi:isoleucyl-tRNA synthetase
MDGVKIARIVDRNESFNLDINDKIISLKPEDIIVETSSAEGYVSAEDGGYLAAIDINLDEKLIIEGMSRELVRTVQEARKKAGLEVSDRIILGIKGSALVETSIIQYRDLIMSETLAVQWEVNQKNSIFVEEKALEKERWTIEISQS